MKRTMPLFCAAFAADHTGTDPALERAMMEDTTRRQAACQIDALLCSSGETDQETGRWIMLSLAKTLWLAGHTN